MATFGSPDYVQWNSRFELGIAQIDGQHKKLVELCNRLYQGVLSHPSGEVWSAGIIADMKACAEYVMVHLRDEEALLQTAGYSDFARHKAEHETYTKKIIETVKTFNNASKTEALQFVRFIYDWIMSHIAYTDTLYVKTVMEYLSKQR